jgi:hypothetical protein
MSHLKANSGSGEQRRIIGHHRSAIDLVLIA